MKLADCDISIRCIDTCASFHSFIGYKKVDGVSMSVVFVENERNSQYEKLPFFHWLSNINIRKRLILMSWASLTSFLLFLCSFISIFSLEILSWLIIGIALLLFYTTFQLLIIDLNNFYIYEFDIDKSINGYVLYKYSRQPLGIINEKFGLTSKNNLERKLFSHIRLIDFIIRLDRNISYLFQHYCKIFELVIFRRGIVHIQNQSDNDNTINEILNYVNNLTNNNKISLYSIHSR